MTERISEDFLSDLEAKHAAIDNDYRPTCETVNYGNGCPGANDSSVAFWRAAVDCVPAMLAELRERRARDLTAEELTTLRVWRQGLAYEHGQLAVEPLTKILDKVLR